MTRMILALVGFAIGIANCFASATGQDEIDNGPRTAPVTFATDIAPIIYAKCSACHRPGQVGPFSLLSYDDVARRAKTIQAVVDRGYMPPWKPTHQSPTYSNDRSLSKVQREMLQAWIENGCPEGDRASTPPAPVFPDGWSLGKPDLVIRMNGQFQIPASGPDVYRSFVFPLDLPEDKWVKAIELRPQAKSAMHHALFFLDASGNARRLDGSDGQAGISGMGFLSDFGGESNGGSGVLSKGSNLLNRLAGRSNKNRSNAVENSRIDAALARGLGGYVPGAVPSLLPGDLAMALPKGTDIVMQTHFHPSGTPETEQAELALYFAGNPPSKQLVPIQVPPMFGFGANIDIPPGEKNFRVSDSFTLPIDTQAISVGGHAHYICREMKMTAATPAGQSIVLLQIDDWDLDWQDRYLFAQPVELPAGTEVRTDIVFDNSADNPENPYSPPQRIRWGRQSNDEMGSITLAVIAADETERPVLQNSLREHFTQSIAARFTQGAGLGEMIMQLDESRDGKLQRSEAPPRLSGRVFDLLDSDADGALDRDELAKLRELRQTETTKAAAWCLTDVAGNKHKPFDDLSTKAIVLAFISTDCPIANSYQPLLHELASKHQADGIRWFMVHPDPATTDVDAKDHAQRFQIEVPIVVDRDQSIARRVGATITPEVFVFSATGEQSIYRGQIDNLYADYGKKRAQASSHDLADALQAVVAGQPIVKRETKAIGCFISFQEPKSEKTPAYDPLDIDESKIEQVLLSVDDEPRSREIPLRVYLPKETSAAPVVLFSHGLGGSRDGSPYLGKHWAARGYVVVFVQHPGSDDSVWKDIPLRERLPAMRKAANGENFMLRTKDVPAAIDQLEKWNAEKDHPLSGRLDLERIGMSGHSFGAITTQAVSGQSYVGRATFTDPRIKAAVAMSPSVTKGINAERSFGNVSIPWLLMTGTNDVAIIGDADLESRLAVFPALPDGKKYELVLEKATHMAFSERELPGDNQKRNPNHHRVILALSTAFWDAFLKEDANARAWLDSDAVRKILEPADKWQKK